MFQLNQLKERAFSAIVTAVILAFLAAIWQLVTNGGLISSLGGATNSDLELIAPVPSGAVVAFELSNGCPEGWSDFAAGQSRVIVGAVLGRERPPGDDEAGQPLSKYEFRTTGGQEQHVLRIEEMPTHNHDVTDRGHRHRVSGGFSAADRNNRPGGGELTNGDLARGNHYSADVRSGLSIEPRGGGEPHPNMPPHVALYFCKKM